MPMCRTARVGSWVDSEPGEGTKGSADMKKHLALSLAILLAGCGQKEALYQGKPASYWTKGLRDPDVKVRREAVTAMGALKVKDAVPDLIAALKDSDEGVRAKAAEALWALGPEAREAVPALTLLLQDASAGVRLNAAGALGDIGPDALPALPALRKALWDRDPYVRAQAATAVGRFGTAALAAVPDLVGALRDGAKAVRVAALYALAEIGPDAKAALPALKTA